MKNFVLLINIFFEFYNQLSLIASYADICEAFTDIWELIVRLGNKEWRKCEGRETSTKEARAMADIRLFLFPFLIAKFLGYHFFLGHFLFEDLPFTWVLLEIHCGNINPLFFVASTVL